MSKLTTSKKFSIDWFSPHIPDWEKWLAVFKGRDNLRFLEIGCFEGRATVWLLENILTGENSKIDVVDLFEGGMEAGDFEVYYNPEVLEYFDYNIEPFIEQVVIHKGLSGEVLREFRPGKDQFDFIYIDGSHRSPEVLEDSVLCWRLLKPGGFMVLDDYRLKRYSDPLLNPKVAIDVFNMVFSNQFSLREERGGQMCFQKK